LLGTKTISYSSGDYGTVTFDGLNVLVAKGTSKKLVFKVDLTSTIPDTTDYYYLKVQGSDIVAYDADGNSLSVSGNVNAAHTVYITVNSSGTITAVQDADTPASANIIAGSSDVVISKIKFTANDENFTINKLRVKIGNSTYARSVDLVKISYPGGSMSGSLSGGYVDFTGLNWLVEKDTSEVLTISADLNTFPLGAQTGDEIKLGVAFDTGFEAVGDSATVKTEIDGATGDIWGNPMYVRKTVPTVSLASDSASGSFVPGWTEAGTFTFTADPAEDVKLDTIKFTLETNGSTWKADLNANDFRLYDTNNLNDNLLDNTGVTATYSTSTGVLTVTWGASYRPTIAKGGSKSYLLKIDTLSSGGNSYAIDAGLSQGVDAYLRVYIDTDSSTGTTGNLVWYEGGETTAINGYLIKNLPVYGNSRVYSR